MNNFNINEIETKDMDNMTELDKAFNEYLNTIKTGE